MNTNMNELNLNEMEQVNGGVEVSKLVGPAVAGGIFGGFSGGAIAAGLALSTGPAGLVVLGGVAATYSVE